MIVELDILTLLGAKTRYKFAIFDLANPDRPIKASDRKGLIRLLSYTLRSPIAIDRLTFVGDSRDKVQFKLKRPYNDGTHSLEFSGVELVEKLVSLIPRPRVNLIRYFGVFAPNAKHRSDVVPVVKEKKEQVDQKNYWIPWAELLRRTFQIDVTECAICGGFVKVISVIKDPAIIYKILWHLGLPTLAPEITSARSPPVLPFAL